MPPILVSGLLQSMAVEWLICRDLSICLTGMPLALCVAKNSCSGFTIGCDAGISL